MVCVVILEQLGVFLHSEREPLDEGEQARSSVLYLFPDNLGQFVWTVKTGNILGISLHQGISARGEEHLKLIKYTTGKVSSSVKIAGNVFKDGRREVVVCCREGEMKGS